MTGTDPELARANPGRKSEVSFDRRRPEFVD